MTAIFLAFDSTRVAGDKACFLERWTEIRISFDQGAGNTMANSAGLPGIPAADERHVSPSSRRLQMAWRVSVRLSTGDCLPLSERSTSAAHVPGSLPGDACRDVQFCIAGLSRPDYIRPMRLQPMGAAALQ